MDDWLQSLNCPVLIPEPQLQPRDWPGGGGRASGRVNKTFGNFKQLLNKSYTFLALLGFFKGSGSQMPQVHEKVFNYSYRENKRTMQHFSELNLFNIKGLSFIISDFLMLK